MTNAIQALTASELSQISGGEGRNIIRDFITFGQQDPNAGQAVDSALHGNFGDAFKSAKQFLKNWHDINNIPKG